MGSQNVLLVDTNRGSYPLLKTLERNGYQVTTVGRDYHAPLASLSHNYIQADYTEYPVLQSIVEEGSYDAIIPGCTDASYLACASLRKYIDRGIDDHETIHKIINKKSLRSFVKSIGLAQPNELSLADAVDVHSVLIKPVDSFSGSGIIKIEHPSISALKDAIEQSQMHSPSREVILEEFIEGQLYSHSAFLVDNRVTVDFFVKEDCSDFPYAVDTSCLDLEIPVSVRQQVRMDILKLANDLQLVDGLVHTQFILRNQTAYIIEMTRRHPGDLYGLLIQYSTGVDYSTHYLNTFLSRQCKPAAIDNMNPYVIRHTITAGLGRDLWGIAFTHRTTIRHWVPLASAGSQLSSAPQGRVAIMFCESNSEHEHERTYDMLKSRKFYSFKD